MDVLKMRKKARAKREREAEENTRDAPGPTDPEVAADAPAPDALDAGATLPSDAEPAPPAEPSMGPRYADEGGPGRDDPLYDFLARYDDSANVRAGDDVTDARQSSRARYLAVALANEAYALSIHEVREILKLTVVTPVPRARDFVLGVLNKRGVVMPVFDLAACMGLRKASAETTRAQRVLVVGDGAQTCGLRVDAVYGVVEIPSSVIENVPSGLAHHEHLLRGIGRIDGRLYVVLDTEAYLGELSTLLGPVAEKEAR